MQGLCSIVNCFTRASHCRSVRKTQNNISKVKAFFKHILLPR